MLALAIDQVANSIVIEMSAGGWCGLMCSGDVDHRRHNADGLRSQGTVHLHANRVCHWSSPDSHRCGGHLQHSTPPSSPHRTMGCRRWCGGDQHAAGTSRTMGCVMSPASRHVLHSNLVPIIYAAGTSRTMKALCYSVLFM
jgi:hypothetical protein